MTDALPCLAQNGLCGWPLPSLPWLGGNLITLQEPDSTLQAGLDLFVLLLSFTLGLTGKPRAAPKPAGWWRRY